MLALDSVNDSDCDSDDDESGDFVVDSDDAFLDGEAETSGEIETDADLELLAVNVDVARSVKVADCVSVLHVKLMKLSTWAGEVASEINCCLKVRSSTRGI